MMIPECLTAVFCEPFHSVLFLVHVSWRLSTAMHTEKYTNSKIKSFWIANTLRSYQPSKTLRTRLISRITFFSAPNVGDNHFYFGVFDSGDVRQISRKDFTARGNYIWGRKRFAINHFLISVCQRCSNRRSLFFLIFVCRFRIFMFWAVEYLDNILDRYVPVSSSGST